MTEAMAFKLIEATLRDGRHVRIRAIRPDDRDEVVQAYLAYPDRPLSPRHALVGFTRVTLQPGETREIHFDLGPRHLSDVDRTGKRAVMPGDYDLFIGGGQPGTDAPGGEASFSIEGEAALPR